MIRQVLKKRDQRRTLWLVQGGINTDDRGGSVCCSASEGDLQVVH